MTVADTPEDLLIKLAYEVKQLREQANSWFRKEQALRASLIAIHTLAEQHREWAIMGLCRTALGDGIPGVSAPDRGATSDE
jgi:hypothetical protein